MTAHSTTSFDTGSTPTSASAGRPVEADSTRKVPPVAEPLDAPTARTDARDTDVQAQLDDLRLALRDWRRTREYSQPTQKRLEQITLQCAQLVETWQQMQRRRTVGADRAADGTGLERRLHQGTGERIRSLERAIESEWEALPTGPDDTARQISEQAASLVESCVTAANLALRGFENAEARVTALEREIQSGMAQLSRDLQSVLTEIRAVRQPALPGAAPFPLEGVMRIHQELRDSDAGAAAAPALEAPRAVPQTPESTTGLTARVESLERKVEQADPTEAQRRGWRPWYAVAALLVVLAGLTLLGIGLQRRIDARLNAAALQVASAERQRDATVAAAKQEAAQQVADARQTAAQAQIVGNVLAAPDLVRYWLAGTGESPAYAHVLISRSRGLVFSASRLRPIAAGKTYQLWLVTRGGPVSAGPLTPDAQGRVTLATETAVVLPGRLTGAFVTVETAGGASVPSAERVLVQLD
jgi:hypothetical protein